MKHYLTRNRIRHLPFLTCLLWLLFFNSLNAQISLTWDTESGCQIYKPGERKDFIEDIASGNCVRVCENSVVTYTLTGSNNATAAWTVTGGAIQTQSNTSCTVVWGSSGWGFVSVTVNTPNGPRTEEMCLEIIDGPEAQFTIFPEPPSVFTYRACLEEELYFTNLSNDGGGSEIVSYFWDFGDHNYSSEFEPSHTYHMSGDFEITLTVTNACNCSKVIRKRIRINDVKAFDITCNSVVCENGSDTYSVPQEIADICSDFNWKVEGGTITSPAPYGPSINVTWDNVDSSGFGYVTFDAESCGFPCSAVTIKVPVVLSKGTIIGDAVVCANDQYRYTLPQWPTTDFIWSVVDNGTGASIINTDQRNEVIVQTGSAGDIVLRCTYKNTMLKCGGYAEIKIRVRPMGVVTGPLAICQNTSATYTVGGGYIASWTLKRPNNTIATGSGNTFTSLFSIPGKYTLTVTGNDFCQPESPFVIRVDKIPLPPNPASIIGPAKICVSTPIEYSLINTEPGTVLVWSVTNGTISGSNYGNEITVEFNPGFTSYTISVRRENTADPHCQSTPATRTVVPHTVTPLTISGPSANICPSSISGPYNASYLEGETYEWTVTSAAGSISSGQGTASASVQWNQTPVAGTTVSVKVRKCNVFYTASFAVTVTPIPVLTMNGVPSSICPNAAITPSLSASPALTSGTVIWDFGDNSPTETTSVSGSPLPHYYNNPSVNTGYTITATVINPNGCLSPIAITKTFTVMPAPVAFISPDVDRVYCATVTPFTLTATVNLPFDTIKWYKDGNLIPSATTVNLPVSAFGSYYAYVSNANGCGAWTNTINVINSCGGCNITPAPVVTLGASQTSCDVVTATASASPAPFAYTWGISNQGVFLGAPTATNANIQYKKAGSHTILYNATYQLPGGGLCTIQRNKTVIIPFIPKIKYDIVCSATPGMYDIVIYDYSEYYPSAPADTKTFIVNSNNYSVPVGQSSYTVTGVPGGSYNIGIQLTKSGYQTCSYFLSETLPPLAPVTISGPVTACDGTGFSFSSNLAPAPGLFYQWNFGDGTFNASPTPFKIYNTPGTYTVTLTVSTIFGCFVQDTHTVVVNTNTLAGNLTSTSPNCEGDPIVITFNNTGSTPAPSLYTWMRDTSVVGSTTVPTFLVNDSGAYWVTLTNSNGCKRDLLTTNAKFIMTPDPVVEGPDAVCVNAAFTLSGYAGAGTLQYRWLRNNVPVGAGWSSSALLNYTSTIPGAATFTVEVRVPDGSGGYCVSSANYVVTTYSNPPTPSISFTISNCYPYTVNLSATTGTPGTFNWSNGMSGANITTNAGGPYMVTFTNPGGCTSTAQIDVPKDPEVYFWIFPKGCYEFCFKEKADGPFPILGPAPTISFNKWMWIKDYAIDQTGNGVVPNYTISQSGVYQMGLNNGFCYKETKEMEVTIKECKCAIRYDIKSIKVETRPFCHYLVDMFIDNPYGSPIVVNIGSDAGLGIFVPGAVTVPPGGGNFSLTFIPIGFAGGSLEITLTSTNEKGDICKGIEKWNFPGCGVIQSKDGDSDIDLGSVTGLKGNSLLVAPNPTHDVTGLTYTFASETAQVRTIEIYSLMGVLLEKHTPESQTGIWNVDLGRYAAGQYIVVMREDGVALAQKAIIVQ